MNSLRLGLFFLLACLASAQAKQEGDPLPTDDPASVTLDTACHEGDLDQVKKSLDAGAAIDGHISKYEFTPLITAIDGGHLEVAKFLLEKGANINHADNEGSTALLHACWTNHTDCALFLIDAGADINQGSKWGRTPLMYAAKKGNDQIIAALIAHKVNLDANCDDGAAVYWALKDKKLSTLKLLAEAGANLTLMPEKSHVINYSLLGEAADEANLEIVSYLLDQGLNIDSRGTDGSTPLMGAVDYDNADILEFLLGKGAGIDLKDKQGQTALMRAAQYGKMDCIQLLLEKNANIDETDLHGETALTIAGDTGETEVVDLLKDKGAKRTEVHVIAKDEPAQPLSAAHAWALAVSMFYTQRDSRNPKVLGGGAQEYDAKAMLEKSWSIHDKDSLFKELDELRDKGHHTAYQQGGAKLAQLSTDEFLQAIDKKPEDNVRLKAMRASYLKWKDRSGLAWDICRSANLVNSAFACHFITEQEAWDRLTDLARQAQTNFTSWQELSDNFLDGREIWANKRDARFDAVAVLLLNPKDPNSPWNQNPWKTDLGTPR